MVRGHYDVFLGEGGWKGFNDLSVYTSSLKKHVLRDTGLEEPKQIRDQMRLLNIQPLTGSA